MPVPDPRWLVYTLVGAGVFHVGVHPALTGGPVPEVLDSSWLTSGEGLRDSHPLLYARVQGLWDQGRPPNVTVVSDHGTWGDDAVSLGEGLAAQVEGFGTEDGPSFRGLPGFTYASSTLDQVVFTRRGVLPEQDRFLVFTLNSPDKFLTVHRILHAPPMNVLGDLRLRFTAEVAKSLYTASDDFPAFLLTVAGPGLAPQLGLDEGHDPRVDPAERPDRLAATTVHQTGDALVPVRVHVPP